MGVRGVAGRIDLRERTPSTRRRRRCISFSAFAEALVRLAASGLEGLARASRVEALAKTGGVRGRSSRVVPTPGGSRQILRRLVRLNRVGQNLIIREATEAREHHSPRRARYTPLKPSRAGMPGDFRCHRCEYSCAFYYYFAREAAGALGTRHSPRPLFTGRTIPATARAHRAAGRGCMFGFEGEICRYRQCAPSLRLREDRQNQAVPGAFLATDRCR